MEAFLSGGDIYRIRYCYKGNATVYYISVAVALLSVLCGSSAQKLVEKTVPR